MKRFGKVVSGILSILPIVYIVSATILTITTIIDGDFTAFIDRFWIMFIGNAILMVITMLHIASFIHHLLKKNTQITDQNPQLMWVLFLLFFSMFAAPIYWYKYIWPNDDEDPSLRPARHHVT